MARSLQGRAVCPLCLWAVLKEQNCVEPKTAKRIVMLSFNNFTDAVNNLDGKCPHRERGAIERN